MPSPIPGRIAILATGGTIAGLAAEPADEMRYRAAQLDVAQLIAAVPPLAGVDLVAEQVAQIDSKDMAHAIWQRLAARVAHHLAQPDVAGVVVTHGTDTMEETAYFLHRVLAPAKPVVLTGAMRPANALQPDGARNLLDAVSVARWPGACGVSVVMDGSLHSATEVHKAHPYRLDAFDARDAGPLGRIEAGRLRMLRPWPARSPDIPLALPDATAWPAVEIVASHAGANGRVVQALCALGVRGIVAVATGNGTLHRELEAALEAAQAQGVRVLVTSRCRRAPIAEPGGTSLPMAAELTPAKARVELMLTLLHEGRGQGG